MRLEGWQHGMVLPLAILRDAWSLRDQAPQDEVIEFCGARRASAYDVLADRI
jgi:hypothetical protein